MADRDDQGQVLVFTGNGKGKTTAALGTALRAAGYGYRVLIIQFIKGTWHSGEIDALERLPQIQLIRSGAGFYKMGGDDLPESVHRDAAAEGLAKARRAMLAGRHEVIILDEVNNAVKTGLIALDDLLFLLDDRPAGVDLILTGRDAAPEVVQRAHLVTEMREIKHPFQQGVTARKGLDF